MLETAAVKANKTNKAKNKKQKKKAKDNLSNQKENQQKLYEINDIDLLCSIIQNSDDAKAKSKGHHK